MAPDLSFFSDTTRRQMASLVVALRGMLVAREERGKLEAMLAFFDLFGPAARGAHFTRDQRVQPLDQLDQLCAAHATRLAQLLPLDAHALVHRVVDADQLLAAAAVEPLTWPLLCRHLHDRQK